ncbi:MAG: hypothetical protein ABEJ31_14325, partial [Haloarculaceae archaeon]
MEGSTTLRTAAVRTLILTIALSVAVSAAAASPLSGVTGGSQSPSGSGDLNVSTSGIDIGGSAGGGSIDCELAPPSGDGAPSNPCDVQAPEGGAGLPDTPAAPSGGGHVGASADGVELEGNGGGGSVDCTLSPPEGANTPENPCDYETPGGDGGSPSPPVGPGDLPEKPDVPTDSGVSERVSASADGVQVNVTGGGGHLNCTFAPPEGTSAPSNPCDYATPGGSNPPVGPGDLPTSPGDAPVG